MPTATHEITIEELHRALATELRPHIKARLLAVHTVLTGQTRHEAERRSGLHGVTIDKWVDVATRSGLQALTAGRKVAPHCVIDDAKAAAARTQIGELLARPLGKTERLRLECVSRLLNGDNAWSVAKRKKVSQESLYGWLRTLRQGDVSSLLDKPRTRRRVLDDAKAAATRTQIGELFARPLSRNERLRLECVLRVLGGDNPKSVAEQKKISLKSLYGWLRTLRRGDASSLLAKPRTRKRLLDVDPTLLRAEAARETHEGAAKALHALAFIAEGCTQNEAARNAKVSRHKIWDWLAAYRMGGTDALRVDLHAPFRPSLLTPQQKRELAMLIRSGPRMPWADMLQLVRRRYGADYSLNGLMRLVREDLKIQRNR